MGLLPHDAAREAATRAPELYVLVLALAVLVVVVVVFLRFLKSWGDSWRGEVTRQHAICHAFQTHLMDRQETSAEKLEVAMARNAEATARFEAAVERLLDSPRPR